MNATILALAALSLSGSARATPTMLVLQTPAAQTDDARAKFDSLVDEYEKARSAMEDHFDEWLEEHKLDPRTATEEQRAEFDAAVKQFMTDHNPAPRFLPQFEALAREHKGKPLAVDCWMQVIDLDNKLIESTGERPVQRAVAALLADHLDSERLESFCAGLRYGTPLEHKAVVDALTKIRTGSPHRKVKAAAAFALASEFDGERGTPEEKASARALYADLVANYADVTTPSGKNYGRMAEGYLFEIEHLSVGALAPDFEVLDETGARFKLSDYRGKVVMLDFWGFW